MKRSSGILLPLFSLPSPYGIGCLDSEAYRFVDFLSDAGQSFWQILPLSPTGFGDSPYQSFASFAGSPLYLDLEDFIQKGWLTRDECNEAGLQTNPNKVDYGLQYERRLPLLRKAFEHSRGESDPLADRFVKETPWLDSAVLFMALKDAHHGAPWYEWAPELRHSLPDALFQARERYAEDIAFHTFLQYHFHRQWMALKEYAHQKGVAIIGDLPIYVADDSADVWSHPELFQLNGEKRPSAVAGCPPDGFSPNGQLWGNPLYNWHTHAATGYNWWLKRLEQGFSLFDVIRIDHFRGFDAYYAIPADRSDAHGGHWEPGPGMDFFRAVRQSLGERNIIVEDLGFVTDSVRTLVRESGFPNMKVLEFAFDLRDGSSSEHIPHRYPENCVAYTGTHDNQTLAGWLKSLSGEEIANIRGYLGDHFTPIHCLPRSLIALLMRSPAHLTVIPMQDWLGLDDESRINTPSTSEGNWCWRMSAGSANPTLAREIRHMTDLFDRR